MARVTIVFEDAEDGGINQSIERSRNDCQDEPTMAELFAEAIWHDLMQFTKDVEAGLLPEKAE